METAALTLIRKYENRKLYDTTQHRYTTVNELIARARKGERFKIEHKEGVDVTHQVMLNGLFTEVEHDSVAASSLIEAGLKLLK